MPFFKQMRYLSTREAVLPAHGLLYNDKEVLSPIQRECVEKLITTISIEHEAYLSQHPEIKAMLSTFLAKIVSENKMANDHFKSAATFFTKPFSELDAEIRAFLKLPPIGPYTNSKVDKVAQYSNDELTQNLLTILKTSFDFDEEFDLLPTKSSSFISNITSDTTLPTPIPSTPQEPALAALLHDYILSSLDKTIYKNLDEYTIHYDIAYVAIIGAVETAMEISVKEIKYDIAAFCTEVYYQFELIVEERERIAREIASQNRISKKLKKGLRREKSFRGYEPPPSDVKLKTNLRESSKKSIPQTCKKCLPWTFNRYPKDRFGTYLSQEPQFIDGTITVTPDGSDDDMSELALKIYGSDTKLSEYADSLHSIITSKSLKLFALSKEANGSKSLNYGSKENIKPQNI